MVLNCPRRACDSILLTGLFPIYDDEAIVAAKHSASKLQTIRTVGDTCQNALNVVCLHGRGLFYQHCNGMAVSVTSFAARLWSWKELPPCRRSESLDLLALQ